MQVMKNYGTQARIQEYSSGGSNFPKILTSKKKKKKKKKKKTGRERTLKRRVVVVLSLSQKYGLIDFTDNYLHISLFSVGHVFCTIASPSLHKYTDDMVVLILFSLLVILLNGGEGLGSSPRNFLA